MKTLSHIFYGIVFLFCSCASAQTLRYEADNAQTQFLRHKTIAILPVEYVQEGKFDKDITDEEKEKAEIGESILYQRAVYEALLANYARTKGVEIQKIETTREILKEKRFHVKGTWVEKANDLAQILGVDAVVRAKIEEIHFIPENEARQMAMETGFGQRNALIRGTFAIIGKENEAVLWRVGLKENLYAYNTPEMMVNVICKKMARSFPYNKKNK